MSEKLKVMSGAQACAEAVKLISPKVIPVYPITPQTIISETLAQMVSNGEIDAELINVESEHSAISACIGAQATGVRTYTATSSQGLALMHEMLFIASGLRLPIVMGVVNRALSAPLNIWCFSKNAKVLMKDLVYKPINEVKIGDEVLGSNKGNLEFSKVTNIFKRTTDKTIKLSTDEFELVCTPEHKFYYHPSHLHWAHAKNLKNKKLKWFGYGYEENENYRKGWLAGMADGDGCFFRDRHKRFGFKLKIKDREAITIFTKWSNSFGFGLRETDCDRKRGFFSTVLTKNEETGKFQKFLEKNKDPDFCRGYLAGIYDSEGSGPFKVKQAVIYNSNPSLVEFIAKSLENLGISFKIYTDKRRGGYYKKDNYHIKINNVPEFFIKCRPIIERKRKNLLRMSIRSIRLFLEVKDVTPTNETVEVYNLETETNNYIVNGFLVHNCDQQDSFSERDSGWIQLYVENAQESFDTHIQAYKIAEELKTPVMVCLDGYVVSHTYEPIKLLEKQKVKQFLGEYIPDVSLNPTKPVTMGPVGTHEFYIHFRKQQQDALEKAKEVIMRVNREFASMSKRAYGNGLIEIIGLEGKENALITIGSVTGTARAVLEKMENIGIIRVRSLRPFPVEELQKVCSNLKSIGVLEKDISIGANGSLYDEVRSALYGLKTKPAVSGFIAGLGGRDIKPDEIEIIMKKIKSGKEGVEWIL